jgi:hypothetical protein
VFREGLILEHRQRFIAASPETVFRLISAVYIPKTIVASMRVYFFTGSQFRTVRYEPPAARSKGVMVKDVGELVAALKQKGLI